MARGRQNRIYVLVFYDVTEARRLQRLARLMEGYGQRVQYSVFECYLTRAQVTKLEHEVDAIINKKKDSVMYVRICSGCHDGIVYRGVRKHLPPDSPVFIV